METYLWTVLLKIPHRHTLHYPMLFDCVSWFLLMAGFLYPPICRDAQPEVPYSIRIYEPQISQGYLQAFERRISLEGLNFVRRREFKFIRYGILLLQQYCCTEYCCTTYLLDRCTCIRTYIYIGVGGRRYLV